MQATIEQLLNKNADKKEYLQTLKETWSILQPVLQENEHYRKLKIFERLAEPERTVSFRVTWLDRNGDVQVNKGYRVQMNSAIGPYKGGLRFHPSVNESILNFLAFEQIFKNALTGLPLGAAKGGADFNPKGRNDQEVMNFCQSFIGELYRHIGTRVDIPAGDIGVGQREIGYMFGLYKKLKNEFSGSLTGKGASWGGSLVRSEATGYGLVFFAENMLKNQSESLQGKRCVVSGAGNVALYAMEKIIDLGGKPVTASDSSGFIYDEEGINQDKLQHIKEIKLQKRGRIREYTQKYPDAIYTEKDRNQEENPLWQVAADCIFPCATQNEISEKDARNLVNNEARLLAEGANMPLTAKATEVIRDSDVLYAPGKASNAGGVAVSGLEMTQNHIGVYWDKQQLEEKLQNIMHSIHDQCLDTAEQYGYAGDYFRGATIAGFLKVADSMVAQGIT